MANETKWTAGPWWMEPRADDPGRIEITAGEPGNALGEVWGDDTDSECWPVTANARLIAAAPALAKEMEDLIELARVAMLEANQDCAEYDIDAELAPARAALASAKEGK